MEFPLEDWYREVPRHAENCDAVTLVMKSQKYFSDSAKIQAFPLSAEYSKNWVMLMALCLLNNFSP